MELVTFQFITLEISALYFFFTLLYWFRPSWPVRVVMFPILFCNPLFLYISNYVTSDALFFGLTMVWFTELIWIVLSPGRGRIWLQTVCVFAAFTFRYNAMYYPLITALAYLLSHQRIRVKWVGTLAIVPLLFGFWLYSRNAGQELTGRPLSSILGGWQLANNALYIRGEISVDSSELPTPACRELDSISVHFFRKMGRGFKPALDENPGNYFIQDWRAPLKIYAVKHYKDHSVRTWAMASPVFAQYGVSVIQAHPWAYIDHFVLMNTRHYFLPSLEKLMIYNLGLDTVAQPAQVWFNYKSKNIKVVSKSLQEDLLGIFPYLFTVVNFFFLGSLIWHLFSGGYKRGPTSLNKGLLLTSFFWLCNFGFSVFANIVVLRYQFFPMILFGCAFALLYEHLGAKNGLMAASVNAKVFGNRKMRVTIERVM